MSAPSSRAAAVQGTTAGAPAHQLRFPDKGVPEAVHRAYAAWLQAMLRGTRAEALQACAGIHHCFRFTVDVERRYVAADRGTWAAIFHVARLGQAWGRDQVPFLHNLVLLGPAGAGKTEFAALAHHLLGRQGEFVVVETGGLVDTLIQPELFGATKGAFTSALASQGAVGRANDAKGGTVFLDEFLDLPALQGPLLRFLQSRQYRRVGEPKGRQADHVLVILATNLADDEAGLAQLVTEPGQPGPLRADLHGRLGPMVSLAALRDRPEALEEMARVHLARRGARGSLDLDSLNWLKGQDWPGNVRELVRVLDQTVDLLGVEADPISIPPALRQPRQLDDDALRSAAQRAVTNAVERGLSPWVDLVRLKPSGTQEARLLILEEASRRRFLEAQRRTREHAHQVVKAVAKEMLGIDEAALSRLLPERRRIEHIVEHLLASEAPDRGSRPGAGRARQKLEGEVAGRGAEDGPP